VGDFNGARLPDLAVANFAGNVSILVNDGHWPRFLVVAAPQPAWVGGVPGHPGGGLAPSSPGSSLSAGAPAAPLAATVKPADAFFAAEAEPQVAWPAWRPRMRTESVERWGALFGAQRRWADVGLTDFDCL
jgi:hypothetical protein